MVCRIVFLFLVVVCFTFCVSPAKSQSLAQPRDSKKQVFFEKVYLMTDREMYVAGENLWYNAYLVNAQDNRLIGTSHTLYVELVSATGQSDPQKQIIELKEGTGHGDFELDEDLKPGKYVLRAWTNWMRNFGDNFVFEKELRILKNPLEKENSDKGKSSQKAGAAQAKAITNAATANKPVIQFLPEGGSLLNNVAGVVAYKALDASGRPVPVAGEIVNSKGEVIVPLESKEGNATFLLRPEAGQTYRARGKFGNGQAFEQTLPAALATGYSIHLAEKDSLYQIIVSTNAESGLLGKDVLLAGKSHGLLSFKTQFTLQSLQQLVSVYKSNFPEGIATITLYDTEGRPRCERLVYVDKKTSARISIIKDKTLYSPDEKIGITLKVTDELNNPMKTAFSVAALDGALAPAAQTNIASYLLLESELKGKIEDPGQYFDSKDSSRSLKLDLLMLTQGWRDFLWKRLADTALNIIQIPENGITIAGTLKRKLGDNPIAQASVTVRSVGKDQSQLLSGTTDARGRFYIDGFKFVGEQKFNINALGDKGKMEGWLAIDPLFKSLPFEKLRFTEASNSPVSQREHNLVESYRLAKKRYSSTGNNMLDEVEVKEKKRVTAGNVPLNDLGYPDKEFLIADRDSDYHDLRHYLLTNHNQTGLDDSSNYIYFRSGTRIVNPRFFVDNRELFFLEKDTEVRNNIYDTCLSLRMKDIKKVTVKHLVGVDPEQNMQAVDYFLVYLSLKEGALFGPKRNPIIAETKGYYEARQFYEAANNVNNSPQSATLFWSPLIRTGENGEATFYFPAAGARGQIKLDIQGISSKGNPLVVEEYINVN